MERQLENVVSFFLGGGEIGGAIGGGEGWGGEKFLSKCYPIHIQCIYIKICTHNSSKDKKQLPWSEVGK